MSTRCDMPFSEQVAHFIVRLIAAVAAVIFVMIAIAPAHAAKRTNFTAERTHVAKKFYKSSKRVRLGSARHHVVKSARRHGVPVRVALAVCKLESGCRCGVRRGRAGEIGPMQVLPATARAIGASLRGCARQVDAGVRYLRMALRKGRICHYNSGVARRCNRQSRRYEALVRRIMRRM